MLRPDFLLFHKDVMDGPHTTFKCPQVTSSRYSSPSVRLTTNQLNRWNKAKPPTAINSVLLGLLDVIKTTC